MKGLTMLRLLILLVMVGAASWPAAATETRFAAGTMTRVVFGQTWQVAVEVRRSRGETGSLANGTVRVLSGAKTLATGRILQNGEVGIARFAIADTEDLVARTHAIEARFTPAASQTGLAASVSRPLSLTVQKAKTAVALEVEPRLVVAKSATLTARVTNLDSAARPRGTATFFVGDTELGTAQVVGGRGQIALKTLGYGPRKLRVEFRGTNFAYSLSPWADTAVGLATGPDRVINTGRAGDQTDPAVAGNPVTLGALVVWASDGEAGSASAIMGRLLDADGNPVGEDIVIRSDRRRRLGNPAVVANAAGEYVVAYEVEDSSGTGSRDVEARGLDSTGRLLPPALQPGRVNPISRGDQHAPAIARAGAKGLGVAVVWSDAGERTVKIRLYDDRLPPTAAVAAQTAGQDAAPSIAPTARGTFLVSWVGSNAGAPMAYFQEVRGDGARVGKLTRPKTRMFSTPTTTGVLPLPDGGAILGWDERNAATEPDRNPYLALFDSFGQRPKPIINVPIPNAGDQYAPALAALKTNLYGVAWADSTNGGIWFQGFDANGERDRRRARVDDPALNIAGSADRDPALAPVGAVNPQTRQGTFVVVWTSHEADGSRDIRVQTMITP